MTTVTVCVRCSAITTKGTRCTRNTCIYPGECFQHFQMRHGLKLAPSRIPNAGLGVYTTKRIPPYTKIADYTGRIISNTAWELDSSDYGVKYDSKHTLDARETQDGLGRYVNDCRTENKSVCAGNNANIHQTPQKNVYIQSNARAITANSEIYAAYGQRYWNQSGKKKKARR